MASRGLGGKIAPRNATPPRWRPGCHPGQRDSGDRCGAGFRRRHGHDRQTPSTTRPFGNSFRCPLAIRRFWPPWGACARINAMAASDLFRPFIGGSGEDTANSARPMDLSSRDTCPNDRELCCRSRFHDRLRRSCLGAGHSNRHSCGNRANESRANGAYASPTRVTISIVVTIWPRP